MTSTLRRILRLADKHPEAARALFDGLGARGKDVRLRTMLDPLTGAPPNVGQTPSVDAQILATQPRVKLRRALLEAARELGRWLLRLLPDT